MFSQTSSNAMSVNLASGADLKLFHFKGFVPRWVGEINETDDGRYVNSELLFWSGWRGRRNY